MPDLLTSHPQISAQLTAQLEADYLRLANEKLTCSFEDYIRENYAIDFSAEYAGIPVRSPFGKASGQLSMTKKQVQEDIEAGLGFVVLKTVIAQNEQGAQSMEAWATKEAKMTVEPITGKSGKQGWTVSWKGRGWGKSFEDYLELIREANSAASGTGTLIVPSCKYHLPASKQEPWNLDEYAFTTSKVLDAWQTSSGIPASPMPFEKDFSPTLAGDSLSEAREQILHWLNQVPKLIRESVPNGAEQIRLGLKIFNTLFNDKFQVELLKTIHQQADCPDFFIYGNRLFDPNREFEGKVGIAYGGPDLSERNLSVLKQFHSDFEAETLLPFSATGNIHSGRVAAEYLLCGAENFQMHTFFQLPSSEYLCRVGNKTYKALHELYFHPTEGLIAWLHHLAIANGFSTTTLRFKDLVSFFRHV